MEHWAEAVRRIDSLAPDLQQRAEVRYARARAAAELKDYSRVVRLLDGLEAQLPLLRSEIVEQRAEAQLHAGPYPTAGEYFAKRADVVALTKAALAFERAGRPKLVHAVADRGLRLATKRKAGADEQAELRALRARAAEKLGKRTLASADLRWLATLAPTSSHAAGADQRLAQLVPARTLSKRERYQRALAMAEAGQVEQTQRELKRLGPAPGPPVAKAELLYAQAWALYQSRSDYPRAAGLFAEAARSGSRQPVRDQFYAARAWSRAQQDERALKEYDQLVQRYRRSAYAERAEYLAARLAYIGGRWDDACRRYGAYLRRYKDRGRYSKTSRYERAVASLAAGKHQAAERAFEKLAQRESEAIRLAAYRHLYAVALAKGGHKARAAALFRRVIRDFPLSFWALVSAVRLRQQGEHPPAPISAAASGPPRAPLLIKLPPKAQLLHRIGLDRDAEAILALHEARLRSAHPGRGEEAVCEAYARLGVAARRYRAGRRAARWKALRQAPSPATRWLWECLYPRPYLPLVRAAQEQHRLPPFLIHAVMRQESGFRPGVVSPARAVGLMQLIEPTARRVARELHTDYRPELLSSPPTNIRFGTYYLRKLLSTFAGHPVLAAAAYNAGPAAVSRWLESGEQLPLDLFVARIPYQETRYYASLVVANLARYSYLWAGADALPQLALELPQGLRAGPGAY